ncbi:hypothetical protein C0J52_09744, partial [Blattella germanica]
CSAFQNFFSEVTGFLGDLVYLVHAELKNVTHFAQSGHISLLPQYLSSSLLSI